jgi:putative flippase GtrA
MNLTTTYLATKYLNVEFVKYLFVGLLNFFFGLFTFYFLLNITKLDYKIALSITWILGVFLTYVINFIWVFKPENKIIFKKRFFKYLFSHSFSFAINLLALHYLVSAWILSPFIAQCILMPLFVIFNFFAAKLWSLKRVKLV